MDQNATLGSGLHASRLTGLSKSQESGPDPSDCLAALHSRRPPFVTTSAHKAARTKALKTVKVYSAEEAEAISPSSVYVRLSFSSEKLRQSGISTIKTKWEEQVACKRAEVVERESNEYFQRDTAGSSTTGSDHNGAPRQFATSGRTIQPSITNLQSSATLNSQFSQIVHTPETPAAAATNSGEGLVTVSNRLAYTKPFTFFEYFPPSPTDPVHYLPSYYRRIVPPPEITSRNNISRIETSSSTAQSTHASVVDQTRPARNLFTQERKDSLWRRTGYGLEAVSITEQTFSPRPLFESDTSNTTAFCLQQEALVNSPQRKNRNGIEPLATPASPKSPKNPRYGNMAPVRDPDNVDNSLKDTIQKLYEVQSQVHGFVPETQPLLIDKLTEVAHSLAHLQKITSTTHSPNNPIHNNRVAPEVIDYVDDSRNPDIYNREFAELVQRGNTVMSGKQQAFKDFSLIFAAKLKEKMPHLSDGVDKIMAAAKLDGDGGVTNNQKTREDDANGAGKTDRKSDARKEGEGSANGARNT